MKFLRVLPLALACACGESDSREQTGAGSSVTMASIGTMPADTGMSVTGDTAGDSAPTEPAGTTMAATSAGETSGEPPPDSDSFPQTSVVSWNESGGFEETATDDCENVLYATVRDFSPETHPDFEYNIESDPGIVLPDLGPDDKPVYAGQNGNPTTNGQQAFDQWYRDVPGVNQPFPLEIALALENGQFVYDNPAFFPIDGQGFGNEGNPHNYHFTLELHTLFNYGGGEVFKFRGDDDLFVFINRKLAIDLGGVHGPQEGVAVLDDQAAALGITPGGTYQLDFFFAERHTSESNFRIETTIACLAPPG